MKVALLADSLGFGGAQRQIANLAVCLKEDGYDVVFLRYRKDDFYRPLLEKAGIEPILIEHKNPVVRMLRIRKVIHSHCPDVVISFMTAPNFYACVAKIGRRKMKVINSERVANEAAFQDKKLKVVHMMLAKYADAIISNSRCATELWRTYYPKAADRLGTIYNIIDVPALETTTSVDDKCRLIVAARYEKEKNLDGLLRAVALLSEDERSKLEIHWYGKANIAGAAESVIDQGQAFIEQNGLSECVFLHPATDQIYPIMATMDFISMFSHREGLPNAIIEGMTLKKPVIMSTVSDYDVLVDESNGFLCDPKSDEDIADALRCAIRTTREQREEMGQRSYEKIRNICSREAVVAQWESLINR